MRGIDTETAIRVENLSKRYRIGLAEKRHDTVTGAMLDWLRRPVHNLHRLRRLTTFSENGSEASDLIWALKDISFDVKHGEVVGIIGRNGAGKSTLLKILSRITHPTSGRVELNGRVSSLLEIGTGFHPELTGRENVYLNGTILGMRKVEIDHKFDEIVDFSGVEKFIDTPVKRYSSGMRVRLAFSVAAHLESEILLIDEVLAVGDVEFQKKCLGKMGEVANEGRTVLFVSHNMGIVQELCERGVLLDFGKLLLSDDMVNCIQTYSELLKENPNELNEGENSFSIGPLEIVGSESNRLLSGKSFSIRATLQGIKSINSWIYFIVEDFMGRMVIHHRVSARDIGLEIIDGNYSLEVQVPQLWLSPGIYTAYFKILSLSLANSSRRVFSERIVLVVERDSEVHIVGLSGIASTFAGKNNNTASLAPPILWKISQK